MKLSEMNTDQLNDCLIELSGPIEKIGNDKEFNNFIKHFSEKGTEKVTVFEGVSACISSLILALCKTQRENVYIILSAMTGKSVQEIANQNGFVTIKEAKECIDRDFVDFFRSSVVGADKK